MKKISPVDRLLLLATALLSAYQVVSGIDGLAAIPTICYTIAFGVLLIAGLLLIILGFEILDSPLVVIVSTLIPVSMSTGLIAEHATSIIVVYSLFAIIGLAAVVVSRFFLAKRVAVIILALVHGVAGLIIFGLPILLSIRGDARPGFSLVGVGGALIGVGGLLLSFLKGGRPILSRNAILTILPGLLLLMSIAFTAGFAFQ